MMIIIDGRKYLMIFYTFLAILVPMIVASVGIKVIKNGNLFAGIVIIAFSVLLGAGINYFALS